MSTLEAVKRRLAALQKMTPERGCSEAEALNAAQLMAELLAEHGLTVSEIEAKADSAAQVAQQSGEGARVLHDVVRCTPFVADFFDCRVWMSRSGGQRRIVFCGFPQDTAAAFAMTELLRDTMEREWRIYWAGAKAQSHVNGRSARTSFMSGFAARVGQRFREMKAQAKAAMATQTGTALVVVKGRELNRYMAEQNIRLGRGAPRSSGGSRDGYHAGQVAGGRANLGQERRQLT